MGVHTSKIHLLISVTIYMFKTAKQQLKTKQNKEPEINTVKIALRKAWKLLWNLSVRI